MRSLTSILVFFLILVSCDISKNDSFYDRTLKQATKFDKIVLLDFSAIWCGGCKAYDIYVFNDSIMREKLNKKFIIQKIDRDKQENEFLVNKFRIHGLPHIVLIDKNEKILGSILGFKKQYVNHPEKFLFDIENILSLQGDILKFENTLQIDNKNYETINDLLKLYKKAGCYIEREKLEKQLVEINPTPQRLFEYNFNQAVNSIKREKDPKPLLAFINENKNLNEEKKWISNSQLLYYYESIKDTLKQDLYFIKLIKIDPDYFTKNYIRFLFEHNLKIDTAIILTNEILEKNKDILKDHWGQFIKAHSLVYQGQKEKAVSDYYDWMVIHKNRWESGDTYWPLYFYASFANFHNLDLDRALEFIKIAESKRHMTGEKLIMSDILYKLGQIRSSIDLLYEVQNQTNDKHEYIRISKLIDKYKNEIKPCS
jgi:thiol-disulfide isomerase/thioredoxin